MENVKRNKIVAVTAVAAAIMIIVAAAVMFAHPEPRVIDEDTHQCSCTDPDNTIHFYLKLGVEVSRTQTTIIGIEPINFVIPPELAWLDYGTYGTIVRTFFMGGTPDIPGTFTVSFDVLGFGHYHLIFVIR